MEAVWISIVTNLALVVIAAMAIWRQRLEWSRQDHVNEMAKKELKKIVTLVDGTRSTMMRTVVDGLRREMVWMIADAGSKPTEVQAAAIAALEEKIAKKQEELDVQEKQVALAEKQVETE